MRRREIASLEPLAMIDGPTLHLFGKTGGRSLPYVVLAVAQFAASTDSASLADSVHPIGETRFAAPKVQQRRQRCG